MAASEPFQTSTGIVRGLLFVVPHTHPFIPLVRLHGDFALLPDWSHSPRSLAQASADIPIFCTVFAKLRHALGTRRDLLGSGKSQERETNICRGLGTANNRSIVLYTRTITHLSSTIEMGTCSMPYHNRMRKKTEIGPETSISQDIRTRGLVDLLARCPAIDMQSLIVECWALFLPVFFHHCTFISANIHGGKKQRWNSPGPFTWAPR